MGRMLPADLSLVTRMHEPNILTDVKNEGVFFVFFNHLEEMFECISTFDFATTIEVHIF